MKTIVISKDERMEIFLMPETSLENAIIDQIDFNKNKISVHKANPEVSNLDNGIVLAIDNIDKFGNKKGDNDEKKRVS
jgi:hypothetical protein